MQDHLAVPKSIECTIDTSYWSGGLEFVVYDEFRLTRKHVVGGAAIKYPDLIALDKPWSRRRGRRLIRVSGINVDVGVGMVGVGVACTRIPTSVCCCLIRYALLAMLLKVTFFVAIITFQPFLECRR